MVNLSIQEWVELNLKPKAVCVIIFGWKKTKLKLMTLKVPQLIYLSIFSNYIWSTRRKVGSPLQRIGSSSTSMQQLEWIQLYLHLIARNQRRKLLVVRTEQFKPSNPLLEEAKAALFVVKKYVKEGFNNIVIEGDAQNFIDWLRSPYTILH